MENYWKDHALESREDLQRLAYGMLNALKPYYSPGKALLHLGETATHHSVRIADMEGFARPLFGLVSLTKGGWIVRSCGRLVVWASFTVQIRPMKNIGVMSPGDS